MIRETKDFKVDLLCAAIEHHRVGMVRSVDYEVGWKTMEGGKSIPETSQKVEVWIWLGSDEDKDKPTIQEQESWVESFLKTDKGKKFLSDYLRLFRDSMLQNLDLIIANPLRWNEFTKEQQKELSKYRQDLLDVPQQEGFPENVVFPDKPDFIK